MLGQFEPGDYRYNLSTTPPDGSPHFTQYSIPFTVPAQPTLTLLPVNHSGIAFRVTGTSNVTYRVLSSATFSNWTVIRTASSAPFTVTNQAGNYRFYKVEVRDAVATWPEF